MPYSLAVEKMKGRESHGFDLMPYKTPPHASSKRDFHFLGKEDSSRGPETLIEFLPYNNVLC
jgi:hypothetical protein